MPADLATRLLSEVLQGDLNSVIVHLLVLGSIFVSSIGGAVEELDDYGNWRLTRPLDPRGATHVDHSIQIEIVDIVIELVHLDAARRLVTDAQHLGAGADRRNVL